MQGTKAASQGNIAENAPILVVDDEKSIGELLGLPSARRHRVKGVHIVAGSRPTAATGNRQILGDIINFGCPYAWSERSRSPQIAKGNSPGFFFLLMTRACSGYRIAPLNSGATVYVIQGDSR